jgi:hypothetical protein
MPTTNKLSDNEQVSEHISKLDPAIADIIQYLRQFILGIDKEIGECIKWNNPCFYYTGDMKPFNPKEYKREIIVMNLYKGKIMLVFPSGAKVNDTSGLLTGEYKDGRRLVIFQDISDVQLKENMLQEVVNKWLLLVEK